MRTVLGILIVISSACSSGGARAPTLSQRGEPIQLRGDVQNDRGCTLRGLAILAISEEQRGSRIAVSDQNGNFVLEDLGSGRYRIQILRGSRVVSEQKLELHNLAVQDIHLVVPALFGDLPSERNRPIVNRDLVRSDRSGTR